MTKNKWAYITSVIFHPLLLPSFFLLILFTFPPQYNLSGYTTFKWLLLLFVFFLTFVIPALLTLLFVKIKVIRQININKKESRIIPLLTVGIVYYITFYTLSKVNAIPGYNLFLLGSTVLIWLTLYVTYFYKISLHLTAWGGFTGALIGYGLLIPFHGIFFWIVISVFLSGIVGTARLTLKEHTPLQVYSGFITGLSVMLLLFLFLK